MRSIDVPRDRPAPASFVGRNLDGDEVTVELRGMTLLVAVKNRCDGCRDFVRSDLEELRGVRVVIVSATNDEDDEWRGARQQVLVAPEVLARLDVRWPPFYVLVDATVGRVVTEGVVFGPSQVADEIEQYLAS